MSDYLSESINDILSIARLAPSVHNSQPWKVKVRKDTLIILLNRDHILVHGDPTGRQAYISLGIFTEACLLALRHFGFKEVDSRIENEAIVIKVRDKTSISNNSDDDIKALQSRFTDRTVYKKTDFPPESISRLNACWHSKNVQVYSTSNRLIIDDCARLTRQALLLAFSNPAFRKELTEHLSPNASVPYGIPLSTLGTTRVKTLFVKSLINSGVNRRQEAQTEYKRWMSASGLVFVLAAGDSKPYWLESGRAYLRASLEIQKMGLSQATSAAIVEAADFHEDIEKLLDTDKRIQAVIRVGRGRGKKHPSGRFTAEELLAT